MGDLLCGYLLIAVLAAGLFLLTQRAVRDLSPRACTMVAAAAVTLLYLYVRTLWYDVHLAELLPFSNLVVVGNWLPLFAAVLAALSWQRLRGHRWRQVIVAAELGTVGIVAAFYPLLGTTPHCGDRWDKLGTCLQTTRYTCSPAAAAMLLRKHGIAASEQEMAKLCLTRSGTSWQGLYRGLKLKTAGTAWDVQVCAWSADELLRSRAAPILLSVGLDRSAPADTDFTLEQGWTPGRSHNVVLEGYSPTRAAIIADPTGEMWREQWDDDTLRMLWRGYGFRLVPRKD